jgi:hypothetical protein
MRRKMKESKVSKRVTFVSKKFCTYVKCPRLQAYNNYKPTEAVKESLLTLNEDNRYYCEYSKQAPRSLECVFVARSGKLRKGGRRSIFNWFFEVRDLVILSAYVKSLKATKAEVKKFRATLKKNKKNAANN